MFYIFGEGFLFFISIYLYKSLYIKLYIKNKTNNEMAFQLQANEVFTAQRLAQVAIGANDDQQYQYLDRIEIEHMN